MNQKQNNIILSILMISLKDADSYLRKTLEFMFWELVTKNCKYMKISFMTSMSWVSKIVQQFRIKTCEKSSLGSWVFD